jgi:hypothetical protein
MTPDFNRQRAVLQYVALVVNSSLKVKTIEELVALSKTSRTELRHLRISLRTSWKLKRGPSDIARAIARRRVNAVLAVRRRLRFRCPT